jgi:hypothetical protein
MKVLYILILLLAVIDIPTVQQSPVESMQNVSPEPEGKKVCVIRNVVNPSAVWFQQSITLTQAIKEAGGMSPDSKNNQVRISRRLEGSEKMVIDVDLRAIEKGRAKDLPLEDNDIVDVIPKDKKKGVSVTEADCSLCGCKIINGMHGYMIVH